MAKWSKLDWQISSLLFMRQREEFKGGMLSSEATAEKKKTAAQSKCSFKKQKTILSRSRSKTLPKVH